MRPHILSAVQHAHDQHAIRLLLVKHDVAAVYEAAEAFGLQILTHEACERVDGPGKKRVIGAVETLKNVRPLRTIVVDPSLIPKDEAEYPVGSWSRLPGGETFRPP